MSETSVIDIPADREVEPAVAHPTSTPEAERPDAVEASSVQNPPEHGQADHDEEEFLRKLPPEIGTLLVMIGVAGVFLPGVVGTPLLIAGAAVVWPKTFEPMERKFAKWMPGPHRCGMRQIKRFIDDLNSRFPE